MKLSSISLVTLKQIASPNTKKIRVAFAMIAMPTLLQLALVPNSASGETIADAQAQANQIAGQLNSMELQIAQLVLKYNQSNTSLQQVNRKALDTQAQISKTQTEIAGLKSKLSAEAINAYVTSGNLTKLYTLLNESPEQSTVRQEFLNTVANSQSDTEASYQAATQNLKLQQSQLKTLQAQAATALKQATAARNAAQIEIDQEKTQLASVNSTLATLVAQRQAFLAQQAAAKARALAIQQAEQAAKAAQARSYYNPPGGVAPPPGIYADPLRAVAGLVSERIDQGVDFSGYGPIYAVGSGVVISTYNAGWPGGTFIAYRLTSGPGAGLIVYVAEDVQPLVSVGQEVTKATVIGNLYEGFDGMETGWASPSSLGETEALAAGQFHGSNSTAFGYNFSRFLTSIGSPGGVLENSPPTGSLPSNWPLW